MPPGPPPANTGAVPARRPAVPPVWLQYGVTGGHPLTAAQLHPDAPQIRSRAKAALVSSLRRSLVVELAVGRWQPGVPRVGRRH